MPLVFPISIFKYLTEKIQSILYRHMHCFLTAASFASAFQILYPVDFIKLTGETEEKKTTIDDDDTQLSRLFYSTASCNCYG